MIIISRLTFLWDIITGSSSVANYLFRDYLKLRQHWTRSIYYRSSKFQLSYHPRSHMIVIQLHLHLPWLCIMVMWLQFLMFPAAFHKQSQWGAGRTLAVMVMWGPFLMTCMVLTWPQYTVIMYSYQSCSEKWFKINWYLYLYCTWLRILSVVSHHPSNLVW